MLYYHIRCFSRSLIFNRTTSYASRYSLVWFAADLESWSHVDRSLLWFLRQMLSADGAMLGSIPDREAPLPYIPQAHKTPHLKTFEGIMFSSGEYRFYVYFVYMIKNWLSILSWSSFEMSPVLLAFLMASRLPCFYTYMFAHMWYLMNPWLSETLVGQRRFKKTWVILFSINFIWTLQTGLSLPQYRSRLRRRLVWGSFQSLQLDLDRTASEAKIPNSSHFKSLV